MCDLQKKIEIRMLKEHRSQTRVHNEPKLEQFDQKNK